MTLTAEWRSDGEHDMVLIVEDGAVRVAQRANASRLHKLLTTPGDLATWTGDLPVADDQRDPGAWGTLIIARASTGEVITMDPAHFWEGVYTYFRSRGVDYDTPEQ